MKEHANPLRVIILKDSTHTHSVYTPKPDNNNQFTLGVKTTQFTFVNNKSCWDYYIPPAGVALLLVWQPPKSETMLRSQYSTGSASGYLLWKLACREKFPKTQRIKRVYDIYQETPEQHSTTWIYNIHMLWLIFCFKSPVSCIILKAIALLSHILVIPLIRESMPCSLSVFKRADMMRPL